MLFKRFKLSTSESSLTDTCKYLLFPLRCLRMLGRLSPHNYFNEMVITTRSVVRVYFSGNHITLVSVVKNNPILCGTYVVIKPSSMSR